MDTVGVDIGVLECLVDELEKFSINDLPSEPVPEIQVDAADQQALEDISSEPLNEDLAADPTEDDAEPLKPSYQRSFAFHCLLQDLETMRRFLKSKWDAAQSNGKEVILGAVLTNTAIDLADRLENEFRASLKIPAEHDFRYLFLNLSEPSLASLRSLRKSGLSYKSSTIEESELMYWGVLAQSFVLQKRQDLQNFVESQARKRKRRNLQRAEKRRKDRGDVPGSAVAEQSAELQGSSDVTIDEGKKDSVTSVDEEPSSEQREDLLTLHQYFSAVLDCSRKDGHFVSFIEDEILRRLRLAISQDRVSLATAFAIQLHFDIQRNDDSNKELVRMIDQVASNLGKIVDSFHRKMESWKAQEHGNEHESQTYDSHPVIAGWVTNWLNCTMREKSKPSDWPVADTSPTMRIRTHSPPGYGCSGSTSAGRSSW